MYILFLCLPYKVLPKTSCLNFKSWGICSISLIQGHFKVFKGGGGGGEEKKGKKIFYKKKKKKKIV